MKNTPKAQTNSILSIKTAPEWLKYASKLPDPEKLFGDFWLDGELCFFFSDTGCGKTILSVQIAQSIATGTNIHPEISMDSTPQKVLLCEFELSEKQFENRYKNKDTGTYYNLSENLLRAQIDLTGINFSQTKLYERIFTDIRQALIDLNIKVVIIDNITFIQDTNKFDQAIQFMQKMNMLKKELNLSILVLGHTPKRDLSLPIDENSMAGSKVLMNLIDSSFTIGKSSQGENIRYIKQIKVRQNAKKYNSSNVATAEIIKENGFLSFQITGFKSEQSHLKKKNKTETEHEQIHEAYKSGEYTQQELAEKFGKTRETINRICKKKKMEFVQAPPDDLPF